MSNIPYHGWTHALKADGGTDPVPFPIPNYAYMQWNGTEVTAQNAHVNPATPAPYEEGFVVEQGLNVFDLDLDAGTIEWNLPGEYLVTGWGLFDTAGSGELLSVALDFGNSGSFSAFRVGNVITADATTKDYRVSVTAHVFSFNPGVFGHNTVRLLMRHTDASVGASITSALIHVVRLSPVIDGEFFYPS